MDKGVYRSKASNDSDGGEERLVEPWVEYGSGKKSKQTCMCIAIVMLAVALIVAVCAVVGVTVGLTIELVKYRSSASPGPSTGDDDVCNTEGCVQLSAQVASRLNRSVDPCEDFVEFACGGWRKNNVIPPGAPAYRSYPDQIQNNPINVRLQKVLESGNDGGIEAVRKAMNFYQACMNTTIFNALGNEPLYDLVRLTGGWPLLSIPEARQWSINSSYFYYEKLHQSSAFFKYSFTFADLDISKYVMHFQQTGPAFVGQNYTDASIDLAERAVAGFLTKFGNSSANYTTAARDIVMLDTRVADIQDPATSFSRNLTTLREMSDQWPWFRWEEFVRYALNSSGYTDVDPSNLNFTVDTPNYFRKLGELLQNTSGDVIRDYAKLLFLQAHISYLSGIAPQAVKPGDVTYCLQRTEQVLPIALARPYVEQYVPKQTKEIVTKIVKYIVSSFRARIQKADWLSDLSRRLSLEKLGNVSQNVAYPDQLFNNSYINDLYSTYVANSSDFFGNNLRFDDITNRNNLRLWAFGVNRSEWLRHIAPTTINGFYQQELNQFYLLLGLETEPTFNVNWPDYFNFGGFGSIIGHETTHGYDNNGQQFDQNGIKRMWWSNESQEAFNSRLKCFIDQYDSYTFLGVPVNGTGTLAENLADNGGIQTSFEAYNMMVKDSGQTQQRLPALPYTPDQYFFIAWGQLRGCELATPQFYELQRKIDPHSPGPGRVVGPLVNSEDFAKAFNCPVGSTMNPSGKERCKLW